MYYPISLLKNNLSLGSSEASELEAPQETSKRRDEEFKDFLIFKQMAHSLYILYSKSKATYYVGESFDVNERLIKHNTHAYNPKSFTKMASDWEIALNFKCKSKEDALYLEKFIKRMKSKKFILQIIENPNVLSDILAKK